jgi:hypothetical protein
MRVDSKIRFYVKKTNLKKIKPVFTKSIETCFITFECDEKHGSGYFESNFEIVIPQQVKYLPPNTTSLLQPMDQTVISNFKKGYTKLMFNDMFEHCERNASKDNITTYWKEVYDIRMAVALISKAWTALTPRSLAAGNFLGLSKCNLSKADLKDVKWPSFSVDY